VFTARYELTGALATVKKTEQNWDNAMNYTANMLSFYDITGIINAL
jgi:hypothetical protein